LLSISSCSNSAAKGCSGVVVNLRVAWQVFVTYNAELRGVVVRELDRLFHCAAIQGSWRAMHLLLREFISLQQPVELLEGLRHILRSKVAGCTTACSSVLWLSVESTVVLICCRSCHLCCRTDIAVVTFAAVLILQLLLLLLP